MSRADLDEMNRQIAIRKAANTKLDIAPSEDLRSSILARDTNNVTDQHSAEQLDLFL